MSLIGPFLRQTIATILTPTTNLYGDNSFTATLQANDEYPVKCRFQKKTKYIYSPTGVVEKAVAQAWFTPNVVIDEGYRVRYLGQNYEVMSVEEGIGFQGTTEFVKVYLR